MLSVAIECAHGTDILQRCTSPLQSDCKKYSPNVQTEGDFGKQMQPHNGAQVNLVVSEPLWQAHDIAGPVKHRIDPVGMALWQ